MAQKFRSDIDGLKAIAIIFIVLYHFFDLLKAYKLSDITAFEGGFLGVDIFLVISGFLITKGILSKLYKDEFSLIEFYKKRFLRILPPYLIMLLVVVIVGYFLFLPNIYKELNLETIFGILFIGNYRFAQNGGYFALDSSQKVLLHTWYLSITIQFYVLYPIILLVLSKLVGKDKINLSVIGLFIISFVIAAYFSQDGTGYLLTHTRIWEMFFGGALFVCQKSFDNLVFQKKTYFRYIADVVGVILIIFSIFYVNLTNGNWYISTSIICVLGTALVLLANSPRTILQNNIFPFIGRSSYSLYLWHWPLIIIALTLGLTLDNIVSLILLVIATFIITTLSYKFAEKRALKNYQIAIIYAVLLGFCSYFACEDGANYLSKYLYQDIKAQDASDDYLYKNEYGIKVYQYGDKNIKPHIFMMGDSHVSHYNHYFINLNKTPIYVAADNGNMAYSTRLLNFKKEVVVGPKDRENYFNTLNMMLNDLQKGDKVILANRWDAQYQAYRREFDKQDSFDNFKEIIDMEMQDLSDVISQNKDLNFYLVGPGIMLNNYVINCIKVDINKTFMSYISSKSKCATSKDFYAQKTQYVSDSLIKLADKYENAHFIDRLVPLRVNDTLYKTTNDENFPLYFDGTHYSKYGGDIVGKYIIDSVTSSK